MMNKRSVLEVIAVILLSLTIVSIAWVILQTSSPDSIYLIDSYREVDLDSGNKSAVFVWGFNVSNVNLKSVDIDYKDNSTERFWIQTVNRVFYIGDNCTLVVPINNIQLEDTGVWTFTFYLTQGKFQIAIR